MVDTWLHYFVQCPEVRQFWTAVFSRINSRFSLRRRIVPAEVDLLFGLPRGAQSVNAIILIAKQFITMQKFREGVINFDVFFEFLRRHFDMEKEAALQNNRINMLKARWVPFISNELSIDMKR